jgi:hypothetical protein
MTDTLRIAFFDLRFLAAFFGAVFFRFAMCFSLEER